MSTWSVRKLRSKERSQLVTADALDDIKVYEQICLMSYEVDILARGLDVIFCGLNPASSAAIAGHNFSNGTNRFWAVLHLAGFTDVRLQPQEERRLLEYGCGITAVVLRPTYFDHRPCLLFRLLLRHDLHHQLSEYGESNI